jgi:stage V sporulation protein D (sporulation-specific penicillin-binding protein)
MNKDIGNKKMPIFTKKMKKKSVVLFLIVVALLFGLAVRLLYINSTNGEKYTVQVLSQQNYSSTTLPYKRGDILDRNGMTLATSVKVYNLILDPKVMTSDSKYLEPTLKALSECFGYDENELRILINDNKTKSYIVYDKKLSYETVEPFITLSNDTENNPYVKGVWFETEYERKYPYSSLACSVIGFTSSGNVGTWGIEEYYNETLNGVDGREYGYVNNDNIMEKVTKAAEDGYTVVSTIDLNVQTIVEKYIQQWEEEYDPDNIGVIVMNPQNGEIYAMATDTAYDLNNPRDLSGMYTEEELAAMSDDDKLNALNKMWRNYCLNDSFEPGSTFKPFTVAAALEEGIVSKDQTFVCDGSETIGGYTIGCHKRAGHGTITVSQAIAYSCNDALMQIGAGLGVDLFTSYQERFNFGMKTGIDLPGEASCAGLIFTKDNMKPINLATSSFGQSFNVTMVQLAAGFCSLINGGYYYQPHVVSEIVNAKGGVVEEVGETPIKQNITKDTSDILKAAMVETVEDGTGTTASVDGYIIGGKTGTAEKLPRGNDEYIYSFIGFAGYENPQVVCYTVVDNPKGENIASSVTSKFFSAIMTEVLPYLQVFPDATSEGNTEPTGQPEDPITDNPDGDAAGEQGMQNIPAEAENTQGETAASENGTTE